VNLATLYLNVCGHKNDCDLCPLAKQRQVVVFTNLSRKQSCGWRMSWLQHSWVEHQLEETDGH